MLKRFLKISESSSEGVERLLLERLQKPKGGEENEKVEERNEVEGFY